MHFEWFYLIAACRKRRERASPPRPSRRGAAEEAGGCGHVVDPTVPFTLYVPEQNWPLLVVFTAAVHPVSEKYAVYASGEAKSTRPPRVPTPVEHAQFATGSEVSDMELPEPWVTVKAAAHLK